MLVSKMHFRRSVVAGFIALAFAAPAAARDQLDPAGEPVERGDDIVVTARKASASITGSNVPARIYPQSVRVFDREQLDALNPTRLGDLLDLAGGVARQNDFGGIWDKYSIRGFAGDENSGPDILINRFSSNLGFNAPVDTATVERIEVLKGASAALSGRGEPGGAINIVTKAPIDVMHGAVSASYGSWNTLRLTGDAGGPINDRVSVRLIGVVEDRDSFRDYVHGSRRVLAPSIAWKPVDGIRLLYQAEYMRNATVLDRGLVGIAGNARAMDRSTFLGEPADGDIVQTMLWQQGSLFAELGSGIGFELGASHRDGSLRGFGTMVDFGARGLRPDLRTAGRDRRYHDFAWQDLSLRAELTWKAELLGMTHDLRVGVDRVRHGMDFVLNRARGSAASPLLPIDLFDPVYGKQPLLVPPAFASRDTSFRSESLYGQDLVTKGRFTLLLGARWNSFRETVINRLAADRRLDTQDRGITPRAALTWQTSDAVSFYTSWGESLRLNPSDGIATFDAERSTSTEVGTKISLWQGLLTGQAAIFDMEKRNVLNPNAIDPFVRTQVGRQRSRGVEMELTANVRHDLYVTGVYTYLDAEVRNDVDAMLIGKPLSNVPRHMGSIYGRKTLGRLGVGAGVTHVGERAGDPFGTAYRLPAYTIARLDLGYAISDHVAVRADFDNLFDTYYISSSYASVWTAPGAPRSVRIILSAKL